MRVAAVLQLLLLGLAAASCESSSPTYRLPADRLDHDAARSFAGSWSGRGLLRLRGVDHSSFSGVQVVASGRNELTILGLCNGEDAPRASVASEDFFIFGVSSCSVEVGAYQCTWEVTDGNGYRRDGRLGFRASGLLRGCVPDGWEMTMDFSGAMAATGLPEAAAPPA